MAKSPFQQVKDRFGSKEALVKELQGLVEKTDLFVKKFNEAKGLERVSNLKLLRLHRIAEEVRERFGTREKLVGALVELEGRVKDADYRKHFENYPLGKLLDVFKSAERRVKRAAAKVKPKA
ncbi:MAG: hypothetical protein JXB32_12880 [Deltaproteobacteria bacterium]|nr:hypothetical protein [Deltaproteobacteria bacterium]